MSSPLISIITPTTGEPSLVKLMESINAQGVDFEHIVLWDDKMWGDDNGWKGAMIPLDIEHDYRWEDSHYNIRIPGKMVQGVAAGSALRSVGLMAAKGKYVTFADSDVWYEPNHLQNLVDLIEMNDASWAFCRRKIWDSNGKCIGIDNFESVGQSSQKRVPYVLVDNNTMMFKREFGTSASVLYRETEQYNDDRLMTEFLYKHAGHPTTSFEATVNQVCPEKLENMFKQHCDKIE